MSNKQINSKSKNAKAKEYLDYYIDMDADPQFAVLLRGTWGTGKTFFIKNYLRTRAKNKILFVSLNGINSIKEIEQSFYSQLHPFFASKGMKYGKALVKGILKTAIKVDIDGDSTKNKADASVTLPEITWPDFELSGNRILIFDDLERCQMEIKTILGYINEFVENNGFKVIILADESKILAEESQNDPRRYSVIKEKTIGKTFELVSEIEEALNVFINLIEAGAREMIIKHLSAVIETYQVANYNNLRHLRHAVLNFDLFYRFLPHKRSNQSDFIELTIRQFFAISFEISSGSVQTDQIEQIFRSGQFVKLNMVASRGDYKESEIEKVYQKYEAIKGGKLPISGELWQEFFETGSLENDELERNIDGSFFFMEERKPDWVKLSDYRKLNEGDFIKFSKSVIEQFNSKQIKDKFELVQITGLLCQLSKEEIIVTNCDEIIQDAKKQLKELNLSDNVISSYLFPRDHSNGLRYSGLSFKEFNEFLKFASEEEILLRNKELKPKAMELLDLIKTNLQGFQQELNGRENNQQLFKVPILKEIPLVDLVTWMKQTEINNLAELSIIFADRYNTTAKVIEELLPELPWLSGFFDEIIKYQKTTSKFLSFRIEEDVIPNIKTGIGFLKKIKELGN